MTSRPLGTGTSPEVTKVCPDGLWLRAAGQDYFLSYDAFPWFRDAPLSSVFRVDEPVPGHYHWPELDIDLSQEIIESPERFPLSDR